MANELAAVVMAGGLGTRMRSATPKHLHSLLGRRMVDWVVGAARDAAGGLSRVVEAADASADELALREVNSGIYVFRADHLWPVLVRLEAHNAQGELYVTDTLGLLVADGETVAVHTAPTAWEVEGINTRVELAFVAGKLRDRINEAHMLAGVTIVDPGSTWIEVGVEIEPDVTIHPQTVLRGPIAIAS